MRSYDDYKKKSRDIPQSILFDAARSGDLELFKAFMPENPEILHYKDAKGYSVFMLATYHNHLPLAAYLLEMGANPNDDDFGGNTVLMGAAFKGHTDMIKLLLKAGASNNYKNHQGQSASQLAQMFGRKEALELLAPYEKTGFIAQISSWKNYFFRKNA